MTTPVQFVELELHPIPPDTVASAKQDVPVLIEQSLRDAGQDHLFAEQQFLVEIEKTFPTDEAIIVGLTFLAGIGIETYKFLLDVLRERYEVKEHDRKEKMRNKKRS